MQQELLKKKKQFTEIVNKSWVDAVKYVALYPKMKVEPAKKVLF